MTVYRNLLKVRIMTDLNYLNRDGGERLAYRRRIGTEPGVVWLGGFRSDMEGTKAHVIDAWAERTGRSCLRFDYFGHGSSSGDFLDGTISRWRNDALAALEKLTDGPQILVGSSMGAWIAILLARTIPQRVAGLLLIAPAADFTEALMWQLMPEDIKSVIMEKGVWRRETAYDGEEHPITRVLIEDGRNNLVLDQAMAVAYPVRILQGMADIDVPWPHAMKVVESFVGDVTITLVKNGDHRLSSPSDLKLLECALESLTAEIGQ